MGDKHTRVARGAPTAALRARAESSSMSVRSGRSAPRECRCWPSAELPLRWCRQLRSRGEPRAPSCAHSGFFSGAREERDLRGRAGGRAPPRAVIFTRATPRGDQCPRTRFRCADRRCTCWLVWLFFFFFNCGSSLFYGAGVNEGWNIHGEARSRLTGGRDCGGCLWTLRWWRENWGFIALGTWAFGDWGSWSWCWCFCCRLSIVKLQGESRQIFGEKTFFRHFFSEISDEELDLEFFSALFKMRLRGYCSILVGPLSIWNLKFDETLYFIHS